MPKNNDEEERPRNKRKPADDDDRPRKKKRSSNGDDDDLPRKRKGQTEEQESAKLSKRPTNKIAVAVMLVLLLGGIGFAAFKFGFRLKPGGGSTDPISVKLENWETYTSPENVFKASFPGNPPGENWKPIGGMKVKSDIRHAGIGELGVNKSNVVFFAGYVRFPDGMRSTEVDAIKPLLIMQYAAPPTFSGNRNRPQKVTAGNREWDEERLNAGNDTGLVRWHLADATLHFVGYRSQVQPPTKEAVEQFFTSHEILGGDPGNPEPLSLEGWVPYTSADNIFRASFPTAPKEKWNFAFKTATVSEFREASVKDEQTGKTRTRTAFAGYVRFAKKPTANETQEVTQFLQMEAFGGDTFTAVTQKKVSVGGWPYGNELRLTPDVKILQAGGGPGGVIQLREVGSTIYAAGMKNSLRLPTEKEIEKFFGSFEILDAKPEKKDFDVPPNWVEYAPKNGGFRATMPRSVQVSPRPLPTGHILAITSVDQYRSVDLNNEFNVFVVRFPPNTPDDKRQKAMYSIARPEISVVLHKSTPETWSKLTWGGRDAREFTCSPTNVGIFRETHNATIGYAATAHNQWGPLDPGLAKIFFNSFAFDKE